MPILSYVTKIESTLENAIDSTRIGKIFFPDYSNAADSIYYMNHCQYCGAKRGEFYLHEEPSGAFFIQNKEKLSKLCYFKLNEDPNEIHKFDATIMIENCITSPIFKKEKFLNDFKA